ncbi:beta-ketoacyl-[acyl-carrier-protein] synthase family protein [uncultured Propionibacterium sp.]|uniref:beta-ketoacyl-[acyl-carrier-protein] synthase family protein n=1 Tax=uncultured Propionibacterium sp. TaxID=218066 RepID=UPI00292EB77C|nr:beta-ketoacyl-[acyl-carrier-protein] synthase family protein [uncultured Propionibacterium sp.]
MVSGVLITGAGMVTPIGISVTEFWGACLSGRSGLRVDDRMDVENLPCGWVSGLLTSDDHERVLQRSGSVGRSWSDTLLYDSVKQALDDAAIEAAPDSRIGMIWVRVWPGPSGSDPRDYSRHLQRLASRFDRIHDNHDDIIDDIRQDTPPSEVMDLSSFPANVSRMLSSPVNAKRIEATCAGGLRAIAEAARMIMLDQVDVAIVCAAVSRNTPYVVSQYAQLMALSRWKGPVEQASMPFDRRRSGMVINESSAAVIIESDEHARNRGVERSYAQVSGWGISIGTEHVTAPEAECIEHVMTDALQSAGVTPDAVDEINSHGTSTKLNDLTEARAIHKIFGNRASSLPIAAIKSMTGHGSAASGIVESIASALSICAGVVPPVPTCLEPDPKCDLAVQTSAAHIPVRTVLKNSFGFGGQYASMLFTEPPVRRQFA